MKKRIFDLESAKKNGCWTVQGNKAQILCDDLRVSGSNVPKVIARIFHEGYDVIEFLTIDGCSFANGPEDPNDLTTVCPGFNLQRALDNNGMCKTIGGEDARIIYTNRKDEYPIVALIGEREDPFTYTLEGIWDKCSESDFNLVNI